MRSILPVALGTQEKVDLVYIYKSDSGVLG